VIQVINLFIIWKTSDYINRPNSRTHHSEPMRKWITEEVFLQILDTVRASGERGFSMRSGVGSGVTSALQWSGKFDIGRVSGPGILILVGLPGMSLI
jgi:hypothetical protein